MEKVKQIEDIQPSTDEEYRSAILYAAGKRKGNKRPRLTEKEDYGKLKVQVYRSRRLNNRKHYHCQCDCGREVWLQAYEIKARNFMNEGCALEGCTVTSSMGKQWFNPTLCLYTQWASNLYADPFNVDQRWSGAMEPGERIIDEHAGLTNFTNYALTLLDHRQAEIWVGKQIFSAPFMQGNLKPLSTPLKSTFNKPRNFLFNGYEYKSYQDLHAEFGWDMLTIRQKAAKHKFSFDAYTALMTHS